MTFSNSFPCVILILFRWLKRLPKKLIINTQLCFYRRIYVTPPPPQIIIRKWAPTLMTSPKGERNVKMAALDISGWLNEVIFYNQFNPRSMYIIANVTSNEYFTSLPTLPFDHVYLVWGTYLLLTQCWYIAAFHSKKAFATESLTAGRRPRPQKRMLIDRSSWAQHTVLLTERTVRIDYLIQGFLQDVITHPWPRFDSCLGKLYFGWIIIYHNFMRMHLFNNGSWLIKGIPGVYN